ncbi:MAG: family 78 glycoside hydrolase catalytic domain [Clostridia bacterium]|nr:family 78 glycoside hydrolase catalytic domain [Clostridia bacterium]
MKFSTKFISATKKYNTYFEHIPAPLFRKAFEIEKDIDSAEITICGLGFYKLYINGKDITKGMLAPYISNPDHILYYDSYNIAPLLKKGKNVIGIILGNGMLNCPGGAVWEFEKAKWRSAPKVALTAELRFADGGSEEFEADESFKVSESPIWFDDLRSGVFYNALKEQNGWNTPDFDDSGWGNAFYCEIPRGEARLCKADPIVASKRMKPVAITKGKLIDYEPERKLHWTSLEIPETTEGHIFDFGINTAGVFEFKISGAKPGTRIEFFTSETLDENGDLDTYNFAKFFPKYYGQRDIYICKGGEESFIPDFTYHGYRYLLVTGLDDSQVSEDTVTYIEAHTRLEQKGGFFCSDETANTIEKMTLTADVANFFYFPTDCPHREKNGWTGDAALSAEQMTLNFSVGNSYKEWLRSIRKAMNAEGALPGIVPTGDWGYEWGNGPAWDAVLTFLPYYTYIYTGDREIIEENATAIFRYLNYISSRRDKNGLVAIGLGDWVQPERNAGDPTCPLIVTDSIYCMTICEKAAYIFNELNMKAQYEFASTLYNEFREAIRKHLVDFNKMTVFSDTQSAVSMAIYYGVFEKAEIPLAAKRLAELVHQAGDLFDTGALGGRCVFHALADCGYAELAYKMISGPGFPSYGYWIEQGYTALCESFHLKGFESLNHHFWGDVSSWYLQQVAGIRVNPNRDDLQRVDIKPNFIDTLTFAEGWHNSVNGKIFVRWDKDGDTATIKINIPEDCYGYLILPEDWVIKSDSRKLNALKFAELKTVNEFTAVKLK